MTGKKPTKRPTGNELKMDSDPDQTRYQEIRDEVDRVVSIVQEAKQDIQTLNETLERALTHLGKLQDDHDRVKTGLWEKTAGLDLHCANLQEAHNDLKQTVWSNTEEMQQAKELWADMQRDLTVLAETISGLSDG